MPALRHPRRVATRNVRLAIVGTPRSGNTWLRGMLGAGLDLEQIAARSVEAVAWDALPERCIIQLHAAPDEVGALLRTYDVRPIVPARHPFDALISGLNYVWYYHLVGHCPGDDACNACSIVGRTPRCEEFLAYAAGSPGRSLLDVSRGWWTRPGALRVRYEHLVADTTSELERLVSDLNEPPATDLHAVVEAARIENIRDGTDAWHCH